MVLLMMPSESCDTDASASGIIWPKVYGSTVDHFDLTNVVVPIDDAIRTMPCWYQHLCVTSPKQSCCTSFQLSWPNKCNGSIDDTTGIMWFWHCWIWYHMTKITLHLILIVLTPWLQWWQWLCHLHHVTLAPVSKASHYQNSILI